MCLSVYVSRCLASLSVCLAICVFQCVCNCVSESVSVKIERTWSKIDKKCSQNLWKLMLKSTQKASWERLRLQGRICMNRGSPNPRKSIKIWFPNRTKLIQKAIQKGCWKPLHIQTHFWIDLWRILVPKVGWNRNQNLCKNEFGCEVAFNTPSG